ncbi:MAG: HAD family phosphatase [Clostridia bacterium]|nr:HAD family phosphatase [Clostridia bacterium]
MEKIWTPKDGTIDILSDGDKKYVEVKSKMGYPAIYPLHDVKIEKPIEAVLMDLDGTSVKSESFWIWIIQSTVARLIDNPKFELDNSDIPFVSGFSVSEHLQYCINKYCPEKTVEEARKHYFEITDYEMNEIMEGRGRANAFTPADGLKDFLYELKAENIKIGLVTSGLYRKAMPEIISAFNTLGMGDPVEFYDCIITGGYQFSKGQTGTLCELAVKPHPWLYAEAMRFGLGIPFERRHHVIGIEDSTAGIVSVHLSGVAPIGIAGGNIESSDIKELCSEFVQKLDDVLSIIA